MTSKTLVFLSLLSATGCFRHTPVAGGPALPPDPNVEYSMLTPRQAALFQAYPGVTAQTASAFWEDSLNLSQRIEYAGVTRALLEVETAHQLRALLGVTAIHGDEPGSSASQYNNQVVWSRDAAARFSKLRGWSAHIALLHPGQYGYQENRDGNPFWGMVVLFDEKPENPDRPTGQVHIDFRSAFEHYQPVNGDIGNQENYQRYSAWYGPLANFQPQP